MSSGAKHSVFEDIFAIEDIDKGGKKFDRVSRFQAHSQNLDMDLTLDYNIELYPLRVGDRVSLVLATSLAKAGDGNTGDDGDDKDNAWRPDGKGKRGVEEDYDYVMHGKIYKFDGGTTSEVVTVYASFGGLLMSLTGSFRHMSNIILGDPVYLLLRK
ncbi:RNA polymerase [Pterulicium gracile]|uniref:DNA-directed RNA polymerases I, II, and III subunit RPABC3 n=1 Tax=Pterulicium gracile TaxID=1884261 RepID=A0A5C3QXB1_9AGAR|nr:RNA polymerase [Pterula gracilis]